MRRDPDVSGRRWRITLLHERPRDPDVGRIYYPLRWVAQHRWAPVLCFFVLTICTGAWAFASEGGTQQLAASFAAAFLAALVVDAVVVVNEGRRRRALLNVGRIHYRIAAGQVRRVAELVFAEGLPPSWRSPLSADAVRSVEVPVTIDLAAPTNTFPPISRGEYLEQTLRELDDEVRSLEQLVASGLVEQPVLDLVEAADGYNELFAAAKTAVVLNRQGNSYHPIVSRQTIDGGADLLDALREGEIALG